MRWWTTPDGRILVEGAAEHRVLEHVTIEGAHTYYLCSSDETVLREYRGYNGSVDVYLYVGAYVVRDGALHEIYRQHSDSGRETATDDIILDGLTPADPAGPPAARLAALVDAAEKEYQRLRR